MFELSTPTALSPIHGALVENLLSLKYREVYFWTGQNRIHVDFTYEYDPAANLGLRNILSLIETTLSNLKSTFDFSFYLNENYPGERDHLTAVSRRREEGGISIDVRFQKFGKLFWYQMFLVFDPSNIATPYSLVIKTSNDSIPEIAYFDEDKIVSAIHEFFCKNIPN
jgi:hypothetical protein